MLMHTHAPPPQQTSDTRAMAKTSVGTPLYLSPEIVNGNRTIPRLTCGLWDVCCTNFLHFVLLLWVRTSEHSYDVSHRDSVRVLPLSFARHHVVKLLGNFLNLNPRTRPSASVVLREPFARSALETLRKSQEYDEYDDDARDEKTKSPIQSMRKSSPRTPPEYRATIVRRTTPCLIKERHV